MIPGLSSRTATSQVIGAALSPRSGAHRTAAVRRAADFAELAKPRLVLMVVGTALVGFYLATSAPRDYVCLLHALIGTALAAAGALSLNQFFERDVDARMRRTRCRPLPEGRVRPAEALFFGTVLTAGGILWLLLTTNVLCATVTALTALSYLALYTPLKRRTPLCTVAGALTGALPPVTGWTAAAGSLGFGAAVLFAMLFFWQLPHSLAIASLYRDDYARAGICLLPVTEPDGRRTGRQALLNSLVLLGVAPLPTLIGLAGTLYLATALVAGGALVACALTLRRHRTTAAARRLLVATLVYLPVILLLLATDKAT